MSHVPWVGGTVEGVAADLRKSRAGSPNVSGIVYAAAVGMIRGLAEGYTPGRAEAERLADIRTVLDALELVVEEGADR